MSGVIRRKVAEYELAIYHSELGFIWEMRLDVRRLTNGKKL